MFFNTALAPTNIAAKPKATVSTTDSTDKAQYGAGLSQATTEAEEVDTGVLLT